ncbi:MAG: hypothetical protein JST47_13415 [Bacteroidetes bacterium]|nr:hypothetical protein [Bacteroidota bacterium]MBS1975587.1 hypothetical protein [Bacteroidota bacterium]
MPVLEKLNELLNRMQLDIRLEIILAELVSDSLSMDDISVINNSLFKRCYHRDIEKTEQVEYGHSKKKKLRFVVNRDGVYDKLPEDLFHQPTDTQKTFNKEKIIKEIKFQDELEQSARQFFNPFEQEFYRLRVKLETEEKKFLFDTNGDLHTELIDSLWDFPDFFDSLQKSKLCLLMPVVNKIAGDMELISFVVSAISGDEVEICRSLPRKHILKDGPVLGNTALGKDSILDGELFSTMESFNIKIFLQKLDNLTDYMPEGQKMKLLEFLCNLFMPIENDTRFELDFSKTALSFVVENEMPYFGRLNYTTVI